MLWVGVYDMTRSSPFILSPRGDRPPVSGSLRTVAAKCTAPPQRDLWERSDASRPLKNLSVSLVKGTSTKGFRLSVKTTAASPVLPGSLLKEYSSLKISRLGPELT